MNLIFTLGRSFEKHNIAWEINILKRCFVKKMILLIHIRRKCSLHQGIRNKLNKIPKDVINISHIARIEQYIAGNTSSSRRYKLNKKL